MSSLLPCWLSKTNDLDQLLQVPDLQFAHFLWQSVLYMQSVYSPDFFGYQVFVKILPEVAEKRRLSIVTYLIRYH